MIRGRDDHGVDVVGAEERLIISDRAGNPEVLGHHPRLLDVVVADGHDLDVPPRLQGRKVIDLGNDTDADNSKPDGTLCHGRISRKDLASRRS
jgi:hypothetical protein